MADTRRISITEALVELKLYDQKINKALSNVDFIGCKKKSADKVGSFKTENFVANAKAEYQSVSDLIENRHKLKKAIVDSNANTIVEIGGKKYTVAAAIEYKTSIMYDKMKLQTMKSQWNAATNRIQKENNHVDAQVDKMLETFLGKDSEKKVSEADLSAISDPYRAKNEWELVDPLNLYAEIQTLEAKIDAFEAEVDVRLSISNSVTYIEV